jgi:aspartyl protease family protein
MLKLVAMFAVAGAGMLAFGQGLTSYYGTRQSPAATPAKAALATAAPAASGPQAVSLAADSSGHFSTDIRINGQFLKGLVDTGATIVAIPLEEARKIGINPQASAFDAPIQTANGVVKAARIKLNEVRIGSIVVHDVEGMVVPNGLPVTLIGMSFFKRLQSFEMRGKTLVLRQ